MFLRLVLVLSLASAAAAAQSQPTPAPRTSPAASPTPTASPTPVATPGPQQQTVFELQARLRQTLARPEVRRGMVGVKVISASSGKVVFEENAEKYFMPASNMKNFTVAAALDRFGPDHRFVTGIYAAAAPDADGNVAGDLRIYGRGDVSMSDRFTGDPNKSLDALVEKIVSLGIKRINGSIVGDDSYFRGFPIPSGWEWDDLQWSYGAEVSALPLNDSVIDVSVRPGTVGYACTVQLKPFSVVFRVVNNCVTAAAGTRRSLNVHKRLDQNVLELTGVLPTGDGGFTGTVSVSRPAEFFAAALRQKLIERGIIVSGSHRYEKRSDGTLPNGVELGSIASAPMSVIAAQTMKPSQNMYTETLLWSLGETERNVSAMPGGGTGPASNADSAELGIASVRKFLTGIGVAPDGVLQYDGSGLSRHNLITPAAVVQLYNYMGKSRYAQSWRDSLTIGGVDGTLRNRFRGTRAQNNVRGKTGTIDQVSALSGYVRTAAGEELIFSMVVNGVREPGTRVSVIDEMANALANFNGRID